MKSTLVRITGRKSAGFLFLILFCSYFASVTFFHHSHVTDGVTVFHSHPYKSNAAGEPVNHKHTKSGFLLIQFISNFIATAPVFFIGVKILLSIFDNLLIQKHCSVILNLHFIHEGRPRAPAF